MYKIVMVPDALPGLPGVATEGLSGIGLPEVACPVPPGDSSSIEFACATEVIGYIATDAENGFQIDAGEPTMGYGASGVRIRRNEETRRLVVEELAEPTQNAYGPWVPGVARIALLMQAGDDAMRIARLEGRPSFPSIRAMAMRCSQTNLDEPFNMTRDKALPPRQDGEVDTGWIFLCLDPSHQHDETTIRAVRLIQITAESSRVVPFLGVPVGTSISFDDDAVIVFPPGSEEGHLVHRKWSWQPPWRQAHP